MTTHCQICGRPIKANTGVIAHHGYKRPGHGWGQTSSCYGARHKPYEVSCDAIAGAIEAVKDYITRIETFLADFIANPPAELKTIKKVGYKETEIVVQRPENFVDKYDGRFHSYASIYRARKYEAETDLKHAQADLVYLTKRLADWVPPAAEPEAQSTCSKILNRSDLDYERKLHNDPHNREFD
jgi:hypothetical protein